MNDDTSLQPPCSENRVTLYSLRILFKTGKRRFEIVFVSKPPSDQEIILSFKDIPQF